MVGAAVGVGEADADQLFEFAYIDFKYGVLEAGGDAYSPWTDLGSAAPKPISNKVYLLSIC